MAPGANWPTRKLEMPNRGCLEEMATLPLSSMAPEGRPCLALSLRVKRGVPPLDPAELPPPIEAL
ncbi:hypothetical protein D3C86_2144640 [compost metagenome]